MTWTVDNWQACYAVCLHEIGHTRQRASQWHYTDDPIPCEVDAWKTAINLAIVWTPKMQDYMRESLDRYLIEGKGTASNHAAVEGLR